MTARRDAAMGREAARAAAVRPSSPKTFPNIRLHRPRVACGWRPAPDAGMRVCWRSHPGRVPLCRGDPGVHRIPAALGPRRDKRNCIDAGLFGAFGVARR